MLVVLELARTSKLAVPEALETTSAAFVGLKVDVTGYTCTLLIEPPAKLADGVKLKVLPVPEAVMYLV